MSIDVRAAAAADDANDLEATPQRHTAQRPMLTVIVPTRNEAGNIEALLARIQIAATGIATEVIFVDDSTDGTPEVISAASTRSPLLVSLIHRPPERRVGGLGGAVAEGIRAAAGRWLCVMDADLQHPPEVIPQLLDRAREADSDIVVASRFAPSGEAGGLNLARAAASWLTRLAARVLFPGRLGEVCDPLSGFFLVRREAIDPDRLRPRGFKILLEILVRFPHLRVVEVPFRFERRYAGESKANTLEGMRYLALLLELRFGSGVMRMARFGLVGATGIAVNQLLLAAFTELGALHYLLSAVLATQGSTAWNLALADAWVFKDRSARRPVLVRLAQSLLVNNAALLVRGPLLVLLTAGLGLHYLVSNVITLAALTVARYVLSDRWIWAESPANAQAGRFNYDIHGIIRITSDARLPELAYFRTPDAIEHPDLRVRIGWTMSRPSKAAAAPAAATAGDTAGRADGRADGQTDGWLRYRESVGNLGFWVQIKRGVCTEVVAGQLLRFSPHVLYTNVVEPILRWMMVQRGYALMHGACLATDQGALLVTARTDTGKTTTILRLLERHPLRFLSDDMVILRPDGRVLCYPKPLTISRHTLEAVNGAADLTRLERLALPLQSRVHSKSGRLFAKLLARMPLPVATINTLVQMVVPPPKYFIKRMVPTATLAHESTIVHRVEIERGPDYEALLDAEQAEEMALDDCEDAYGFPPYQDLEPFLTTWGGQDLRAQERKIIGGALGTRPTRLIRRESRDWWARVIDLYVAQHADGQPADFSTGAYGVGQPAEAVEATPMRDYAPAAELTPAGTA